MMSAIGSVTSLLSTTIVRQGVRRTHQATAPGEAADRGDFEPGAGTRLATLVAARQAAPPAQLGERVLDLVVRSDRGEPARASRRRLDVEREELACSEPGQAPIGAVAGDGRSLGSVSTRSRRSSRAAVTSCARAEQAAAATGRPGITTSSVRLVPIVRPPRPPA